jgi:hypothetical protein
MKDNKDPKVLYEKLNEIRNMYSHANFVVQEAKLASAAMQKAPDLYRHHSPRSSESGAEWITNH